MPGLHLTQPGFIYSASGPFPKHYERIQKFREPGNLKHLYSNELDKAYFAHDAVYSDSKIQLRDLFQTKFLKKTYEIAINLKYDGYQRVLASMVCKFFDKKTRSGVNVNEELAEEIHKPVIKNSRRVYAGFKDNSWAAD